MFPFFSSFPRFPLLSSFFLFPSFSCCISGTQLCSASPRNSSARTPRVSSVHCARCASWLKFFPLRVKLVCPAFALLVGCTCQHDVPFLCCDLQRLLMVRSRKDSQRVKCDTVDSACTDGLMDNEFEFAEKIAMWTEDNYSYTSTTGTSLTSSCTSLFVIRFQGSDPQQRRCLGDRLDPATSFTIAIEADSVSFQLYSGGVLLVQKCLPSVMACRRHGLWFQFRTTYGKLLDGIADESTRFEIFKRRVDFICGSCRARVSATLQVFTPE